MLITHGILMEMDDVKWLPSFKEVEKIKLGDKHCFL